ncbi:hypothetical protein M011DRAFT_471175 [Sporormia fimetaria CBS 119925]|uniref:Killer toxin Kp4 domain-containing protein n=1 Tax=Sporormia fimetaria CBS 119925 TaxID=1340428 RepID=A0A6A6V379_9PLEO|nr:hypothetical protein M011DRAFT_471175 [Sporormia fimetaria CBS 119925]
MWLWASGTQIWISRATQPKATTSRTTSSSTTPRPSRTQAWPMTAPWPVRGASGSSLCRYCSSIYAIIEYANGLDDKKIFPDRKQIVCSRCNTPGLKQGLCMFPKMMNARPPLTGRRIKELLQKIKNNGCRICGSVPAFDGKTNFAGELTVNYVHKSCGSGICK